MAEDQCPQWAVRLRVEREQRIGSKAEFARRLMRHIGVEPGAVASLCRQMLDWEKGLHYPETWAPAIAAVLEMSEEELFGARRTRASSMHGATEDDEVKRRQLLGLLGTAAAAIPLARDAEPLRAALTRAVTTTATDRDADAWEQVAHDYAREVGVVPGHELLPDLINDFAEICALLEASMGQVRLRVIHSTAQLAALTAITLVNLGDHRSARRWWRTAAKAADESGDPAAASLVRGRQSVFALYDGRRSPLAILELAQEAIGIGGSTPSAGVISGHAARAQALARLGRQAEASAVLRDIEAQFERLPDSVREDRKSQWGWSEQRLHHVASHVHTFTGDIEQAGLAQDAALASYPDRPSQGRTQIELYRAGCLLRAGDVTEGARHAVRVLGALPEERRRDGLVQRTAATMLALAPESANNPTLRDAYEALALDMRGS